MTMTADDASRRHATPAMMTMATLDANDVTTRPSMTESKNEV